MTLTNLIYSHKHTSLQIPMWRHFATFRAFFSQRGNLCTIEIHQWCMSLNLRAYLWSNFPHYNRYNTRNHWLRSRLLPSPSHCEKFHGLRGWPETSQSQPKLDHKTHPLAMIEILRTAWKTKHSSPETGGWIHQPSWKICASQNWKYRIGVKIQNIWVATTWT